jgi:hypothetical protein
MTTGHTLHVDLRIGEELRVGPNLTLSVQKKSGQRARLKLVLTAPTTVQRAPAAGGGSETGMSDPRK